MVRSTMAFAFYCRASKANKQGESPIELSVSINGERHFVNLPFKCKASEFNKRKRPQTIDRYLYSVRRNIDEYLVTMAEQQIAVTVDNFIQCMRTGGVHTYTIKQLFQDYLKILENRIDVDMDFNHYRKYVLTMDDFFKVIDSNREATSLTNADILRFKIHIAARLEETTQAGYMSRLKAFITFGINNGKLRINPFQGIKIKRIEKPVQTITKEDINKILSKEIDNQRLSNVRDLFLLAAGSGLSFADVIQLEPKDFQEKDGKTYINKQRQKTGVSYFSVLLPFAVDIVKRYNYDLSQLKLSNQKVNAYLKEIQTICDIDTVDSLHFHLARHFYATNAINSGVPLEIVQRLVGHSNIKQTQHYAKLMEKNILDKVCLDI